MRAERISRYEALLQGLRYAVHELPAGVLFGPDGASAKECAELVTDLNEFELLCRELGQNESVFIAGCRWHFERYPHYLGRRRHFTSYAQYIEERGGPLNV